MPLSPSFFVVIFPLAKFLPLITLFPYPKWCRRTEVYEGNKENVQKPMFWTLIYILRVLQIQFIIIARAPLSSPCKILWTLPLDATDNGGNVSSFRLPYFALIWNKGFWKKPHTLSKCGSVGRMNQTLRTRFPSSWRLFEDNGTLFLQNTKPRLLNMSGKRNIQNGKYFTCGVFIVCCPANKTLYHISLLSMSHFVC